MSRYEKLGTRTFFFLLYFLYEASDNYWDFTSEDLHNIILEVVIKGDLFGSPTLGGR